MATRRILVVDDEAPMRLLLEKMLKAAGYEVIAVSGGRAALQEARDQKPDLVILDLTMPGIDGYAVCTMLKRDRTMKMPIIILSARSREKDYKQALDAGCDAFVSKPVNREELLAKVAELLAAQETPEPSA
jgi:DNA-binding response OmpR family regulator